MKPYYADDDNGTGIKADIRRLKKVAKLLNQASVVWSQIEFGYIRKNDLMQAMVEIAIEIREREHVLNESK